MAEKTKRLRRCVTWQIQKVQWTHHDTKDITILWSTHLTGFNGAKRVAEYLINVFWPSYDYEVPCHIQIIEFVDGVGLVRTDLRLDFRPSCQKSELYGPKYYGYM